MLLTTPRLRLRQWRESDLEPFAAMNADPLVMEHFPAVQSRAESDAFARRAMAGIEAQAWGQWALEVVGGAPFIGFAGLAVKTFVREWHDGMLREAIQRELHRGGQGVVYDSIQQATHRRVALKVIP